ncbi:hypothetical protein FRB99_007608 [Tulasnella sp. 403]|nr:hypothetical protein FRB99_007608 [Tulasnella sp. 403]
MSHPSYYSIEARIASFGPKLSLAKSSRTAKGNRKPKPTGGWPHPPTYRATPETLAAAGFYHLDLGEPNTDEVECFMCNHRLAGWEAHEEPHNEHTKRIKKRKCPWAIAVCSIQADKASTSSPQWRFVSSDRLPTSKVLEKARKDTFGEFWPHDVHGKSHGASSKKMAEAGFVFTPTDSAPDMATCPYCNTAFDDWQPTDSPEILHRRKRPNCPVFTARVYSPPQTDTDSDVDEEEAPSTRTSTTQRLSTKVGSNNKPNPSTSGSKDRRLTRATLNARKIPADSELSEFETEYDQAPVKPKKPGTRAKSTALAKSTRSKKVPVEETMVEDAEITDAHEEYMTDINTNAGPSKQALATRRSQSQLRQTKPTPPSADGATRAPSRSASRQVKADPIDTIAAELPAPGTKVSRKKKTVRPPSPEPTDLEADLTDIKLESDSEPAPVKVQKKSSAKGKSRKTEKAQTVQPDDEDGRPIAQPESGTRDRRKTTRGKRPPHPADEQGEEPMEVEQSDVPEDITQVAAKPKRAAKPKGKAGNKAKKAKTKARPAAEPDDNMSDRIADPEAASDAHSVSETDTESRQDEEMRDVEDDEPPGRPLMESVILNATVENSISRTPPDTPRVVKDAPLVQSTTPKVPRLGPVPHSPEDHSTPSHQPRTNTDLPAPTTESQPAETLTPEELAMTLEQFVLHLVREEAERLRTDGEKEIAAFLAKSKEVRRQLEAM